MTTLHKSVGASKGKASDRTVLFLSFAVHSLSVIQRYPIPYYIIGIYTLDRSFRIGNRLFLLLRFTLEDDLLLVEELGQIAVLVHRDKNVGTANEVFLDVKLGNRGPVGVLLDTLAQLRVLEDVEGGELVGVDALEAEDLDGSARKAALGCLGCTLHEEDDGGGGDGLVDGGSGLVGEEAHLEGSERSDGSTEGGGRGPDGDRPGSLSEGLEA